LIQSQKRSKQNLASEEDELNPQVNKNRKKQLKKNKKNKKKGLTSQMDDSDEDMVFDTTTYREGPTAIPKKKNSNNAYDFATDFVFDNEVQEDSDGDIDLASI
jgi:hypothetical protein